MKRLLLLSVASAAATFVEPAQAQAVGQWRFHPNVGSPAIMTISRDPTNSNRLIGQGEYRGGPFLFIGERNGLRWTGNWYWFAPTGPEYRISGIGNCRSDTTPAAGLPFAGKETKHAGVFDFRFDTAEANISGEWRNRCQSLLGRWGNGAPVAFSARRRGAFVGTVPDTFGGPNGPTPGQEAGLPGPFGISSNGNSACATLFKLRVDGTSVRYSRSYTFHPCSITYGTNIEMRVAHPEGRRPVRLVLQGLRVQSIDRRGAQPVVEAIRMGRTIRENLPFAGNPRAGQIITGFSFGGNICAAPLWLVYVEYSDDLNRGDAHIEPPVGSFYSRCGVESHPEMLPVPVRPDIPVEPKPVRPMPSGKPSF